MFNTAVGERHARARNDRRHATLVGLSRPNATSGGPALGVLRETLPAPMVQIKA